MATCECSDIHDRRRVVLTGGPGAGKTAVLELIRQFLRTESATEAADIDARIAQAWERHPRRFVVEASPDFLDKAARALQILRGGMPGCCRRHVVPVLRGRLQNADGIEPIGPVRGG